VTQALVTTRRDKVVTPLYLGRYPTVYDLDPTKQHEAMATQITLHSSPVSDCSGRLRIALNLKGLRYETCLVSLRQKQNNDTEYLAVNPSRTVPTLTIQLSQGSDEQGPVMWTQSIAVLEFLDEAFLNTRQLLLPTNHPIHLPESVASSISWPPTYTL
jgi:hypothetical protein